MCGISACISKHNILEREFTTYNDAVAHRGPDASQTNFYKCGEVYIAFGHRRLSIIDLDEEANQPMSSGAYTIVFNGEIYNYLELKDQLEKEGVSFSTRSDTEVLLKAYIQWGRDCLATFNGMFAFLIYDENKKEIFFARDRFGIKPLYYYVDEYTIYFASEIKQFVTLDDFEPIGNINAIGNFVDNRYIDYSEETFFKNVYQVQGGQAGYVNLDKLKMQKYEWYNLKSADRKRTESFKDLFEKSIFLRLRSDVEVGSCLSGGVDSSSIVCVADKKLSDVKNDYTLQTFTSSFEDKRYDERDLVDITKNKTSIKSHYLFPQEKAFFDEIKDLTYFQDEPIWSSSIYAQSCVFREAALEGVKVMLDGQGADEVFCGYASFFYRTYFNSLSLIGQINEILSGGNKKSALKLFVNQNFAKNKKEYISLLEKKYDNKYNDEFNSLKEHTRHYIKYHLPALLHYEDRNSMRYSIEARLPFLDYILVEAGYNISDKYKIGKGIGKKIIRDSMRGITPDEILDNKVKKGFVTPQRMWMEANKQAIIEKINVLLQYNIFKKDLFCRCIEDFEKGNYNEGIIMRLYSLSIWMDVFEITEVK